jgi:hypothetical protein
MEISELHGIVQFIVRSVCKQFWSCLCPINIRIHRLIHWLFNKDFDQHELFSVSFLHHGLMLSFLLYITSYTSVPLVVFMFFLFAEPISEGEF